MGSSDESSSQAEESEPILADSSKAAETTTLLREEEVVLEITVDVLRTAVDEKTTKAATVGDKVDEAAETSNPTAEERTSAEGEASFLPTFLEGSTAAEEEGTSSSLTPSSASLKSVRVEINLAMMR